MKDLKQKIQDCGLLNVQEHTLDFRLLEATHDAHGIMVGKYLIFSLSLIEINKITETQSNFDDFEDRNISPFFFKLDGDWSWNLYIIFVLSEDDYKKFENQDRKMIVERGKRYGRKYIVNRTCLSDYLPVANLKEGSQRVHKVNPYEEWNNVLAPIGLNFTLDTYNTKAFNHFLREDFAPNTDTRKISIDFKQNVVKPMTIDSINFGNTYRQHCWPANQTLQFSQVNLFEGTNGSGKTSILEAIELAFTGEIARNKMSDLAESEGWEGKLSFFEGDINHKIEGQAATEEQREREKRYYQYQARERARKKLLNQFYHRYNYFTSEDIFKHCYNNERPDFRNEFARIIFGDELSLFEENWQRYKEEFQKKFKQNHASTENQKEEHIKLSNEIKKAQSIITSRLKNTLPLVKDLIQQVWSSYPLYDEHASRIELQQWFEVLYSHISDIEGISRPLQDILEAGYGNAIQLENQAEKVEYLKKQIKDERKKLQDIEEELPLLSDLKSRMLDGENKLLKAKRKAKEIKSTIGYFEANIVLLNDKEKRTRRKTIQQEISTSEKHLLQLEQLQQRWGYLEEVDFEFKNKETASKRLLTLQKEQQGLENDLEKINIQIDTAEEKANSYKKIIAQIKSLGKAYAHGHPQESVCPMCAHDHGSALELQSMIEREVGQDQQFLVDLREKEHSLKIQVQNVSSKVKETREQIDHLETVGQAYTELKGHEELLNFNINNAETSLSSQVPRLLRFISEQIKSLKKQIGSWKQEVNLLEQNGFTLKNIRILEEKLDADAMKKLFSEVSTTNSLIDVLEKEHKFITNEIDSLKEHLENQDSRIQNAKREKEEIKNRKDLIEKEEIKIQKQKNLIDQTKALLNQLRGKGVNLNENRMFNQFYSSVVKLNEETKGILDLFQSNENILDKQNKMHEIEEELEYLTVQQKKCEEALIVMNKLKPLGNYIQEFMANNISIINDIFLRLHTPKDFERLELNEMEELVAYRKRDNQTVPYNINQMSTGQRTALILSTFFVMHMSMETAPNILLLDEPVANMDDLNVLALIDFLRQFTLTKNTQIFFTTANPSVSSLFRRKFSILKERFRMFHIQRVDGKQAHIEVKTFLPDKEKGILVEYTS